MSASKLLVGAAPSLSDHSVPILNGTLLIVRPQDADTTCLATADPRDTAGPLRRRRLADRRRPEARPDLSGRRSLLVMEQKDVGTVGHRDTF